MSALVLAAARVVPIVAWAWPLARGAWVVRGVASVLGIALVWPLVATLHVDALMIARELMIGMGVGLVAALPVRAVEIGAAAMGRGPAVGNAVTLFGLAVFSALGGWGLWARGIVESYTRIPVGEWVTFKTADALALMAGAWQTSMAIALPVAAAVAIAELGRGVIARVQPVMSEALEGGGVRAVAAAAAMGAAATAWVAAIAKMVR